MADLDVSLRIADDKDVSFLAEVVYETNEVRLSAQDGWDPHTFREGLIVDAAEQVAGGVADSTTYVIELAGEKVGRLRLVRRPAAVELAGLQIAPKLQRQGVGTRVVRRVQDDAAASGRRVVLEVDLDNPGAERLYRRLGFVEAGNPTWPDRRALSWSAGS